MNIEYIEKLLGWNGRDNTIERFDIQIKHIKKAMLYVDEPTATVLSDVVCLIEEIKSSIKGKRTIPPQGKHFLPHR